MKPPETPKFCGSDKRWGRPFGQMSSFHLTISFILVLAAFALLITVMFLLKPNP
jgi:hypothetical protein